MMNVITRKFLAINAAKRWCEQYKIRPNDRDSFDIADRLASLGPAPSPDEVDQTIGNSSWTEVRCKCCGISDGRPLVSLDWNDLAATGVCEECLEKALETIRREPKK